jgi:hypothetical protein
MPRFHEPINGVGYHPGDHNTDNQNNYGGDDIHRIGE